jgi:flagellar biosynthesis protein FlhF
MAEMELKTYRVRCLSEALHLISQELGPDASVLHTRRLPARPWKWWDRAKWEVVAGTDPTVPDRFTPFLSDEPTEIRSSDFAPPFSAAHEYTAPECTAPEFAATEFTMLDFTALEFGLPHTAPQNSGAKITGTKITGAKITGAKNAATTSSRGTTDPWRWLAQDLQSLGVSREAIAVLQADLPSLPVLRDDGLGNNVPSAADSEFGDELWQHVAQAFARRLKFAGRLPLRTGACTRVALVGPTGVGKTTTIAKLAADFHLRLGLRVGLITVDTFRVAAVDQLQAYAEILDLPLVVVRNPEEMHAATERFADLDLVLIDTVGRSPRDRQRIDAMNRTLAAAKLDHLLITVSASSDCHTMGAAVAAHTAGSRSVPTSLVLTKVDECHTLGNVYPFLRDCEIPWRYWTNGQQVPDDLGLAQADVAAWFLGEIDRVTASLAGDAYHPETFAQG